MGSRRARLFIGQCRGDIANCDVLTTSFSSTVYVGLALDKMVYSSLPMDELKALKPWQNGCAAELIADVCREVIEGIPSERS